MPSAQPTDNNNGLAFVGESPGRQEIRKGIPFIGESGKLLDKVLEHHGISRDQSLLTNAALCHYPDQKDKSLLPKAIECCRPRLLGELHDAEITTAVTLGNAAVASLLDTNTGITKLRGGNSKESTYRPEIAVIPTFHPAAALRNQAQLPLLVGDIGKAVPGYRPAAQWVPPNYVVIEETEKALRLLKDLLNQASSLPLIVDTESGKEKDHDIARSTTILCVGIASTNTTNNVLVIGRPAILDYDVQNQLITLLSQRGIIAQNGKYDLGVLHAINHNNLALTLIDDTMLMSYALNENPGTHGLKYMGQEYLGCPEWEQEIQRFLRKPTDPPEIRGPALAYVRSLPLATTPTLRAEALRGAPITNPGGAPIPPAAIERAAAELGIIEYQKEGSKRWWWRKDPTVEVFVSPEDADGSFASIPPPLLHKYNAYDVQVTKLLRTELQRRINEQPQLNELYRFLIDVSNALTRVESNGLKVSLETNAELDAEYQHQMERHEELAQFPFNPRSPKQVLAYYNDQLDIPIKKSDVKTLKAIMANGVGMPRDAMTPAELATTMERGLFDLWEPKQLAESLLEHRKYSKLRSTYVTTIADKARQSPAHKIYPSFLIHSTTTGRLSSRNPNAQNIPRGSRIKNQFIPTTRTGVFVQCDYSQAELRVLTWLAREETFQSLFNDDSRDIFTELSTALYGERFTTLEAKDPERKELRTLTKTFAYGLAYGRTAEGIAADPSFRMTVQEAQHHMQNFYDLIPNIRRFQQSVIAQVHSGQDLINPFGRRRRFHLITDLTQTEIHNAAMAYLPQSTASDCCLLALTRLPSDIRVCNVIHDAILAETPQDEAQEVGKLISRTMVEAAEEITEGYVNFAADASVGTHWGELS